MEMIGPKSTKHIISLAERRMTIKHVAVTPNLQIGIIRQ
jgi:hypothetical protein